MSREPNTPDDSTGNPDDDLPPTPLLGPRDPSSGTATPGRDTILFGKRGKYRCRARMGGGAFGQVYKADAESTDSELPDVVAVKIFEMPGSPAGREILCRELAALLTFNHDRIPKVWDWNEFGSGANFIAMQFFPHGNLSGLISHGPLTQAQAREVLVDVLSALVEAHRHSILHLDIKPSNVLLDEGDRFVLGDFGISQALHFEGDGFPLGAGTPLYNAPEQREYGSRVFPGAVDVFDVRTNLYSAAATVWAALAGMELSRKTVQGLLPPCPPGYCLPDPRVVAEVDDDFADLLMDMLSLNPSRRPGSAAEALARAMKLKCGPSPHAAPLVRKPPADRHEIIAVLQGLIDQVLAAHYRSASIIESVVRYEPGEIIAEDGENSHFALILLRGTVDFFRDGHLINSISREGACMGEVASLTGRQRTATMVARDAVWAIMLNGAELERLIARHPAFGIRIMKSLAELVFREREASRPDNVIPI